MIMLCNEYLDRKMVGKSIDQDRKERGTKQFQDQISVLGCDANDFTEQLQDNQLRMK